MDGGQKDLPQLGDGLSPAEQMFIDLLDDEKLFNRKKFEKAMKQEKVNIVSQALKQHGKLFLT